MRFSYLSPFLFKLIFSRTARHTYLVFMGNGVAMLFAFLFTITSIRLLTLSDFGYFSAVFTFLVLISDLADIGIGSSLSRFLPHLEGHRQKLLSFLKTAFFLQLGVAISLTIGIFSSASFLSELFFHTAEFAPLFKITALGIGASILANFFQYTLSALQKFLQASLVAGMGGILRLLFLLVLIPFSLVNLTSVVWTQVIAYISLAIIALFFVGTHFFHEKRNKEDVKNLLHFAFYLGVARSLTAVSSRLDVLMLIAFTNSVETGIYATAARVVSLYPLLAGSFTTVVAPKFATLSKGNELKTFMIKVIGATLGLISSILVLILIAHPFMTILFGEKTAPAVPVFQLLLVAMIFFVAGTPAVVLALYYLKKPHILTINGILQLIIVIAGNFIFIPIFGKFGPAYSLILAYGITFFLTTFMSVGYLRK